MNQNPDILFENDELLVINKPAGLVVHGDGRTEENTLADWLLEHHPALRDIGEAWESQSGARVERPGIVHRLDRDTSGMLVVAKSAEMFAHLKIQFQERLIAKTYRAFAYGLFKEEEGDIERPITKSKGDFRKWSAQPGGRGVARDAHTHWKLLGSAQGTKTNESISYVELHPTTGRTHQLRVHLKAIHHPIVCDGLYAPKRPSVLGFSRLALHAHTLTFLDPQGEKRTFEAPLPEDFVVAEPFVSFI